jgi:hypothetical protein
MRLMLLPVLLSVIHSANVLGASVLPDFKLLDVNTNSVRFNTLISPRDYLLQVSGYYFGAGH